MNRSGKRACAVVVVGFLLTVGLLIGTAGAEKAFVMPSKTDKCPVCGMFVAKYPEWIGEIVFKDGTYVVFDGAKDLFKYYLNLPKYAPKRSGNDIDAIYVTDYYSLSRVDGTKAFYVMGSDVLGPMGQELIPFAKETDAGGFVKDHKGKRVIRFKDVDRAVIRTLD